jgi:hypothetical protein
MKDFTPFYSSKNHLNVEANPVKNNFHSPKKQSIDFILAYSKSVEAKASKYIGGMLYNIN